MAEWQNIETAPKDGTEVLVGVWVGPRRNRRWSQWVSNYDAANYPDCPWGEDGTAGDQPTHFALIPEAPDA